MTSVPISKRQGRTLPRLIVSVSLFKGNSRISVSASFKHMPEVEELLFFERMVRTIRMDTPSPAPARKR